MKSRSDRSPPNSHGGASPLAVSRRGLLRGAGLLTLSAASVAMLAACGESSLPALPEPSTGRAGEAAVPTPAETTIRTEAAPAARGPVKIAVPTGNFLFDRVAVQIAGLATDQKRMAEAPGELQVVQLSQTAGDQFGSLAAAAQAVLAEHEDLDAALLTDASLAFELADLGLVLPVDEVSRASATFNRSEFLPVGLDALSDDGQLFGLPLWISGNVMQFSEGLFTRAGIDIPDPSGWSWDDFLETARRLTELDAGGAPSQWGVWFPTGAAPSQQWIWQNGGRVVDPDAGRSQVADEAAVQAVEFMARIQTEQIGPRIDFSAGPPPLTINNGMPAIQGVPVAMFPSAVGGGFGGRGLTFVFAGRRPGGGGVARGAITTVRAGGGGGRAGPGVNAPAAQVEVGRRGILPLPSRGQAAVEARVFGLVSLLSTSPNADAAFQMVDWLARQLGAQAAIPARNPTVTQLQSINAEYTDADAEAILTSARSGRIIPGRRREDIAQLMLEHIDFPVMDEGEDALTATANAAAAIDELLEADA